MLESQFFQADQDLEEPNTNCKSITNGQLLMFNHHVGQIVDKHAHEETHIVFVRQGRIAFKLEDRNIEMAGGDVLVIPAGTPHSFAVIGDSACRTACLAV